MLVCVLSHPQPFFEFDFSISANSNNDAPNFQLLMDDCLIPNHTQALMKVPDDLGPKQGLTWDDIACNNSA